MGVAKSLLDFAFDYRKLSMSVIPVNHETKRPLCDWGNYAERQPTADQLHCWFGSGKVRSLAVVHGPASNGLVCRDFDRMDSYGAWSDRNPRLAKTLSTSCTPRGRHVWARTTAASIAAFRANQGVPDGIGAITYDDGEFRAGVCYTVLPPSEHPSGELYDWLVPLPKKVAFFPDLSVLDFGPMGNFTQEDTRTQANSENKANSGGQSELSEPKEVFVESESSVCSVSTCLEGQTEKIESLIKKTLPAGPGQRRKKIFEFSRHLKAIPGLAGLKATDPILREYLRRWFEQAKVKVTTQDFDQSRLDFIEGWDRIRYVAGQQMLPEILKRAVAAAPPQVAMQYEEPLRRLLVSICRELQRDVGDKAYFLSARSAGELLGVTHTAANNWMRLMCHDGILAVVEKGQAAGRKASTFRYICPLE